MPAPPPDPLRPEDLDGLDEPVQRYLRHALTLGAAAPTRATLEMSGRIDVGRWLRFEAVQRFDGHDFEWRARAGTRRVKPLRVVDRYRAGTGSTEGTVLRRLRFLHATGPDVARSAAGRAAAESIWVPGLLLGRHGVAWRAEDEQRIVAAFDVEPESVELVLEIDGDGALRTVSLQRWGDVGRDGFGHIPFGGEILAERRFGAVTLPSHVRVGWWWGTPRFKPFFDAAITAAAFP